MSALRDSLTTPQPVYAAQRPMAPTTLSDETRKLLQRARLAVAHAGKVYTPEVAVVLIDELWAFIDTSHRFSQGARIERLIAEIMAQPVRQS